MNYNELCEYYAKKIFGENYLKHSGYQSKKMLIEKVASYLFDLSIQAIAGFDIRTTYILRQHYGILNDGEHQTLRKIGNTIDRTPERIRQIIIRTENSLCWKIYHGQLLEDKLKKPSSLELSEKYLSLKSKTLGELELPNRIFTSLSRMGIKTLNELLTFSKEDLFKHCGFSKETLKLLELKMESMGLRFIDDLSKEEKEELLLTYSLEDKLILSSSLINSNEMLNIFRNKQKYGNKPLKTIGEVLDFVNNTKQIIPNQVLDDLSDLELPVSINKRLDYVLMGAETLEQRIQMITDQNYSFNTLITINLEYLGLNGKIVGAFTSCGFNTIGDLLKLNLTDLNKIRGLGIKGKEDIINSIHGLGLYFKDEVEILKVYSDVIREQLNNSSSGLTLKKVKSN